MSELKCDRCGAFFMPYEVKREDSPFHVSTYNIKDMLQIADLCPKCDRALNDLWQ